jgi:hypothetical protein
MEAAEHNDVERLQSKLMRLQDDQRGQDAELSSTRRELLLKMQGRDEALAASSEHFQLSELTRLQLIKKQLNSFIQHERKLLQVSCLDIISGLTKRCIAFSLGCRC